MMKRNHFRCVMALAACLFCLAETSLAQKKLLGIPKAFETPFDYPDASGSKKYMESADEKSYEEAWMVISDRDDNPYYDKPNGKELGTISFREIFYVVDEEPGWVKLVQCTADGLNIAELEREVGWVRKENLLLWYKGLIDARTKINKKVLLLNKADNIDKVISRSDRNAVDIYKDPAGTQKEGDLRIFQFYFILKRDLKFNRYLLSKEAVVSGYNAKESIIGWVSERDCTPWDNRICLEPNYEEEAFEERKQNPKLQVKAFKDLESAKEYVEGAGSEKLVFWKDDPVNLKPSKMAKSNPRRYKGAVVRFPMVDYEQGDDEEVSYYRSGLIASVKVKRDGDEEGTFASEIEAPDYSAFATYISKLDYKANNINLFFVIEGTKETFPYRDAIISVVKSMKSKLSKGTSKVSCGALVYRDLQEESVTVDGQKMNRLTEQINLTQDFDKVVKFISSVRFENIVDKDPYTALYYGLSKSLRDAGFREDELNILVLLGSNGDFKADKIRKEDAKARGHKALFEDSAPIVESMSKLGVHFYAMQLKNEDTKASRAFGLASQAILLNAAKHAYNQGIGKLDDSRSQELMSKLVEDHSAVVKEPSLPSISENEDISLQDGRITGRIVRPPVGKYIPFKEKPVFRILLEEYAHNSVDFSRGLRDMLSDIINKGMSLQEAASSADEDDDGEGGSSGAGRYTAAMADILNSILRDKNIDKKDLYNSLEEKYQLFSEVYIPGQLKGANHKALSYSLFMPENDLDEYVKTIENCMARPGKTIRERREQLLNLHVELVKQFGGENSFGAKQPEDLSRSELSTLIQGLEDTGLKLEVSIDATIKDITNEAKVSNQEIENIIRRFQDVKETLKKILDDRGRTYEFCYRADELNLYYWIPIADVF